MHFNSDYVFYIFFTCNTPPPLPFCTPFSLSLFLSESLVLHSSFGNVKNSSGNPIALPSQSNTMVSNSVHDGLAAFIKCLFISKSMFKNVLFWLLTHEKPIHAIESDNMSAKIDGNELPDGK